VVLPSGVLASIAVDKGSAPNPVATGFGSVWVATHRSNTLYRIDPQTDKVSARIDLGQSTCGPIAIASGRVWTGFCDDSTKELAVDPTTNQVVGSLQASEVIGDLDGSLWATSVDSTQLLEVDPTTLRTKLAIAAPGDEGVIGGGYVWNADENVDTNAYSGVISKVDPATGAVLAQLHTPTTDLGMGMVYDDGLLWLKGPADKFLVRVDTSTGESTEVMLAGFAQMTDFGDDTPVIASGSLWVRTASGVVSRLSPSTGEPSATFPGDPNAQGGEIAVGFGSLWMSNFDSDTVWRVRIP
jgi:YVTN family beta-propeller protein